MSRLTDLIAQAKAKDPQMGADLEREYKALSSRLPFGLNFERHRPEAVELPQRPVRKGDKVRVLPARGSSAKHDPRLWVVKKIVKERGKKLAELELLDAQAEPSQSKVALDDIVRPDFLFFCESADGSLAVDIVDPHGTHLADALPKLRGLARYAETHPGVYRRIESVAEAGGKLRVLDLTREDVRKAIVAAKDDVTRLYGGALASDYK